MTNRTLVLISYVFPPDNAIGAVRVGKFAQGLARDHGWQVQAVVPRTCTAEPSSPQDDRIRVYKTREIDMLSQVASLRSLARRGTKSAAPAVATTSDRPAETNAAPRQRGALARLSDLIAVPDQHSGWIYFAFREAVRCLRRSGENSVLYSSGPPHSAHVAAAMAKRRTGRRWVADLRDPWIDNPYNPKLAPLAERWNKRLERRVLEAADCILCTTEPARERLAQSLPDIDPSRILTVPNGYDPEDYDGINPKPQWSHDGRAVLVHAGSVYGKRDPTAFLRALALRYAEAPRECPRVVFVGNWDDATLSRAKSIVADLGDSQLVTMLPAVGRREALEIQAAADWLILLGDSMPEMLQIPGKLFEYLAMNKPILSLFPNGSPVGDYLENYANRFASSPPDNVASILAALRTIDGQSSSVGRCVRPVEELERSHQIERVNAVLEGALNHELSLTASRSSEAATIAGRHRFAKGMSQT